MIRSAVDVSRAAYVGGICLCVPAFTTSTDSDGKRWEGLLDQIEVLYGRGSFDAGFEETRFTTLVAGHSRLGRELSDNFQYMRREVHDNMTCAEMPEDSLFKYVWGGRCWRGQTCSSSTVSSHIHESSRRGEGGHDNGRVEEKTECARGEARTRRGGLPVH